jgi:hypothetical protein
MSPKEANELQKQVRTAETRKLRFNGTVRRLAYSVAWDLSFLVFLELRFSRVAVSSISTAQLFPRIQLSLITILGSCRCQFPWCALALSFTVCIVC